MPASTGRRGARRVTLAPDLPAPSATASARRTREETTPTSTSESVMEQRPAPRARDTAVPERLAWAVETMAIGPDERVLEIGCGTGVAVALIARLFDGPADDARGRRGRGQIVGIDRSQTMIARARERNAAHLASGCVQLHTAAWTADGPSIVFTSERERVRPHVRRAGDAFAAERFDTIVFDKIFFDKIFAVNVNAFWLPPATEWLGLAPRLAPGGAAYLFFHPPSASQAARIARDGAALARRHGLSVSSVQTMNLRPVPAVCMVVSAR